MAKANLSWIAEWTNAQAPSSRLNQVEGAGSAVAVQQRTDITTGNVEKQVGRLVRLASCVLKAPAAYLQPAIGAEAYITTATEYANSWIGLAHAPLTSSCCASVMASAAPVVIEDTRNSAFELHGTAERVNDLRAYLGVPLLSGDGRVLGCLCVLDKVVRRWSQSALPSLLDIAAAIVTMVEMRYEQRMMRAALTTECTRREQAAAALVNENRQLAEARTRIKVLEKHQAFLLEVISDGIVGLDENGTITFANNAATYLLGCTDGALLGRDCHELLSDECRLNSVPIPASRSIYRGLKEGVRVQRDDQCFARFDGSSFPVEYISTPIREGGRAAGAVLVFRDVTDRHAIELARMRCEDRYRNFIEHAPDAIVIYDEHGLIVIVNARTERLFGFSRDELVQQPIEMLLPMQYREQHARYRKTFLLGQVDERLSTGQRMYGKRSDGTEFPIEVTLSLVETDCGVLIASAIRDVTEREVMEHAIRDSEIRSRAFLENSATIAWMKDTAGHYIYLSPNLEKRFNLDGQACLHKTDFDLWPRELAAQYRENDLNVLHANVSMEVIEPMRDTHGRLSWWLNCKFPFQDSAGVRFIGGLGIEITERKRAEAEVALGAERLSLAVDLARLGMFEHYHPTDTLYWSPVMRAIYGKGPNDPVGLHDYFGLIHPEDYEWVIAAVTRSYDPNGDGHFSLEHRILRSDGEVRWVSLQSRTHFVGTGLDRRPFRTVGAMADVTDRRRLEETAKISTERFELAAQGSNDGIWDWNLVTGSEYRSDRWHQLLGFSREELGDQHDVWHGLLHPDDRAVTLRALHLHLEQRIPYDVEYRIRNRLGEYRWMHARGQALWNSKGQAVRMAGSIRDITDRKGMEQNLQRSAERLRLYAAQLDQAIEGERKHIARELHDQFGHAFTALKMDLVALGKQIANGAAATDSVLDSIARMSFLAEDNIQLTRRIAKDFRPAVLDSLGLASAIEEHCEQFIRRTGISCQTHLNRRIHFGTDARTTAVFRIFQEAITNVVRHAEATRVQVSLRYVKNDVVLEISDDGKGIGPIADDDWRSLGLLGMRERAGMLHGTLTIRNKKRRGTTVKLVFPGFEH